MKKRFWLLIVLNVVLIAAFGFTFSSSVKEVASQTAILAGNDNELPTTLYTASEAATMVAQNGAGTRPIYFTPQDSNGTATVIILANTDTISHTVIVQSQSRNAPGDFIVNIVVEVEPAAKVYLLSDNLTNVSPPQSWLLGHVLTNFTDNTSYGVIYVPSQVKFDGYVVYNPGTFVVSPDEDQGALPLRFSTDSVDVFLPTVQSTVP